MTDSLADTIEPNSDQLNADDLLAGPITVTVESVTRGSTKEQPVNVNINGHRPYRPCKSMRRVMIVIWGDKGSAWVGKSMTLYRDEGVTYGGVAVGGIRISHMSGIEKSETMLLTSRRGKKEKVTIKPLTVTHVENTDSGEIRWTNQEAYNSLIKSLGNCASIDEFASLRQKGVNLYPSLTKDQQSKLTDSMNACKASFEPKGES